MLVLWRYETVHKDKSKAKQGELYQFNSGLTIELFIPGIESPSCYPIRVLPTAPE